MHVTENKLQLTMGSNETPHRLPVIDFSSPDLKPETSEWETVKSNVWNAVNEYGCFKASFNKIPEELLKVLLAETKEAFALPLEIKQRNVSDRMPFGGYFGPNSLAPHYESLGFDDPLSLERVEFLTEALWPQGKPNFSSNLHSYALKISELGRMIRRMIVESFGLDQYLDEHMNSVSDTLRVIKYGAPQNVERDIGLGSHLDQDVMTIVYTNQGGLDIQTKDGQEWFDAEISPDTFVVFIGESFSAWTNGRLHCPYHRVTIGAENREKYSLSMFSPFKKGYKVKPPKELVDEEHPLLYRPYDHFEYLNMFQTKMTEHYQSGGTGYLPLKAYFGV